MLQQGRFFFEQYKECDVVGTWLRYAWGLIPIVSYNRYATKSGLGSASSCRRRRKRFRSIHMELLPQVFDRYLHSTRMRENRIQIPGPKHDPRLDVEFPIFPPLEKPHRNRNVEFEKV